MQTAAKVLIVGGVSNLAYALLTGFAVVRARMKGPEAPKYLLLSHTGPIMQGILLLALTLALPLSTLSEGTETTAAWILVAFSASLTLGHTMNWLQGVTDEFAERPPGFLFVSLGGLLSAAGIGLLLAGVVRGV